MMNNSRITPWVGRSAIILALPLLAGCSTFWCRFSGGTAGGCYSGPWTEALIGVEVVVAVPFVLTYIAIDGAIDGVSDMSKSIGKKNNPDLGKKYWSACVNERWQDALNYTQTYISKGLAEDKSCHVKALVGLGRIEEAAQLARRRPPELLISQCEVLVRTNQPVAAQAICAQEAWNKWGKNGGSDAWNMAMLGHSLLLQGRTEEAYVQYRHAASRDVVWKGDCHRSGAPARPVFKPFNLFRQQGWQAEESARAQAYLEELYCGLYEVHRLYADASDRKDPGEQLALRERADTKAAELLQGDDLEIVLLYEQVVSRKVKDENYRYKEIQLRNAYTRVAETLKPMTDIKPADVAK